MECPTRYKNPLYPVVEKMPQKSDESKKGKGCGRCLPEVLPREVQQRIDQVGGLDELIEMATLPDDLPELIKTFKALSDDIRWQILSFIAESPMCACVLKTDIDISDSRLSYHLNILKKAGLIEARKSSSFIIYTLTAKGRVWLDAVYNLGTLSTRTDE